MFGRLLNYKQNNSSVIFQFENGMGKVEIIANNIIRIFSGDTSIKSKAIEGSKTQKTPFKIITENNKVVLTTDTLSAHISDNFKVDFYDSNDNAICCDYRGNLKLKKCVNYEQQKLLKNEGHTISEAASKHKVQIVKKMDGDECFYGLGDKTGFLNKRHYDYIMWNTDNPSPHVDSFKSLYKSIPFFITLKKDTVFGIFFDNTYKSYFDMGKESSDYYCFAADDGNLDYYFIYGNTMPDVVSGYTYLTGVTPLPQIWTLGYQQSRWSYKSEKEVRETAKKMRENKIPCDAIHLDIDYMDEYRVFTWNKKDFGVPKNMVEDLSKQGFKTVAIIDPGVKKEKGYHIYDEGIQHNYFVKTPEGETYVNAVWPGDAVYPDFGNPQVRKWWADNYKFLTDMGVRGIWNDMNEPASFNGQLPPDLIFSDEENMSDHARMHNVYGHLMDKSAYEGVKNQQNKRPFIITRACYAGSQKYSTAWTGDNHSIWAHLQMAVPQLCNLSLSGMSFVGTDVGGFGSDVTPELLTRWVQIGCFSPLFRNHSAMDTVHQEPWSFGKKVLDIYRKYVQLRYKLIPYYYDLFFRGEKNGLPILRPLVMHYEHDENVKNLNGEFLIGESILVAPVTEQGAVRKLVYLPKGIWYDYWTGEVVKGGRAIIREAPIDTCPIYIKEGSIIPSWPIQDYVGQNSIDTLELNIYPGKGKYSHYKDDGESFDYKNGKYNEYKCTLENNTLTVELVHKGYNVPYNYLKINSLNNTDKILLNKDKVIVELK